MSEKVPTMMVWLEDGTTIALNVDPERLKQVIELAKETGRGVGDVLEEAISNLTDDASGDR